MAALTLALLLLAPPAAPEFVNVAEAAGLTGPPSGRAVFVDLNSDGRLDVILNKTHIFLQRETGEFAPAKNLPAFVTSGPAPNLVLCADFNSDGRADIFAAHSCEPENPQWRKSKDQGQRNALYLQEARGWRTVVLDMPRTGVQGATACDFDRDGVLDLYLGSTYVVYGRGLQSHPDRLYRGTAEGAFVDVTQKVGLLTSAAPGARASSKPTFGVTHGDFDGDGWQDLFVCTYGRQWNFLWRNNAGKTFADVAEQTGFDGDEDRSGRYSDKVKEFFRKRYGQPRADEKPFRSNGNTFDCALADFDNDGDLDAILAEITHAWAGPSSDRTALLVQEDGRFVRKPGAFGREHTADNWNQGDLHATWLDFDNDGLLDALIASSDYPDRQELKLYRQKRDHTFEAARTFDWEGAAQISVGDVDNDGDLDILCGRSLNRLPKARRAKLGRSVALFRNDVGNRKAWLQIACVGGPSAEHGTVNRDGIGCRVRVTTADGVTQTRTIRGGHGHCGHNNPYLAHFGLGNHDKATRIEVTWPDGKGSVTTKVHVAANQRLTLTR